MSSAREALLYRDEVPALYGKLSVPISLLVSDSSQLSLVLRVYPLQTADTDWQPVKTKGQDFPFLCFL